MKTFDLEISLNADSGAPRQIQLVPRGPQIDGRDGRQFFVEDADLEAILSKFESDKPLPIDWEHSTVMKAKNGERAPAAGWITALHVIDGEIWGDVEWNALGAKHICSKQYRFISPVLLHDETHRVRGLHSAGLTNRPNLVLQALNSFNPSVITEAPVQKLFAALGVSDEEGALNAISELNGSHQKLVLAQNQIQQLTTEVNAANQKLIAAQNQVQTLTTELHAAKAEVVKIQTEHKLARIEAALDAAIEAKKITPAQREYHLAMCQMDGGLERFEKFVEAAPQIIADGSPLGANATTAPLESAIDYRAIYSSWNRKG